MGSLINSLWGRFALSIAHTKHSLPTVYCLLLTSIYMELTSLCYVIIL